MQFSSLKRRVAKAKQASGLSLTLHVENMCTMYLPGIYRTGISDCYRRWAVTMIFVVVCYISC